VNKSKVQRVQILLEPNQQEYLARVSKKSGQSVSSIIRALVAEKMLATRDRRLDQAARELRSLYKTDAELNAFRSLDTEDWDA
jgi:hypothetical protein